MRADLFRMHAELEDVHWWFAGRRRILADLVHYSADPAAGGLVIDVGCGTGANIAALSGDYECLGIDTSSDAIELAAERFASVRFVCGYAPGDIAADMARATLVLASDVLEHVRDDFALLSAILAALPVGAHVLLTVPADASLWSEHDVSFGHYRRYDAARFAALWSGLPVTQRLLSPFNSRLYPLVKAVRTVSRLRGHASGRAGTDLSLPPAPANRVLKGFFAGESPRLLAAAAGRAKPFRNGVSLIALLRRESGVIAPRSRPAGVAPDLHDPEPGQRP